MPGCSGGSCRQGREPCETPAACGLPERRTFEPDLTITGPHRARKQRARARARSFLTAFGIVAAGFILARLALRFFFPGV